MRYIIKTIRVDDLPCLIQFSFIKILFIRMYARTIANIHCALYIVADYVLNDTTNFIIGLTLYKTEHKGWLQLVMCYCYFFSKGRFDPLTLDKTTGGQSC